MALGWNHIILEGYCAKNWDYNRKSSEFLYTLDADNPIEDWEKTPNPRYDPDIKKPEWPEFCKKKVGYNCYKHDCPHLATGKGRMKDVVWVNKHKKKNNPCK